MSTRLSSKWMDIARTCQYIRPKQNKNEALRDSFFSIEILLKGAV